MYTFKNNSFEDNNIIERIESSNKINLSKNKN